MDSTVAARDCWRPFEWLTSPASLATIVDRLRPKRILHVGSGSSVLGEYIVETFPFVSECVNVDIDAVTLNNMRLRWNTLHKNDVIANRLKFVDADLSDRSCLAAFEDHCFDLILDKSTLDCLLCSENGVTGLFTHIHRLLSIGGSYVVVSFHEVEFLRPLLSLPGADWDIHHSRMARQVEELRWPGKLGKNRDRQKANTCQKQNDDPSSSQGRSLNVFQCILRGASKLDYETVHSHVHATTNHWFKTENPIMTSRRKEELNSAFALFETETVCLRDAYLILFTEAEREHLSYDLFIDDWQAYILDKPDLPRNCLSLDTALAFLEEMQ